MDKRGVFNICSDRNKDFDNDRVRDSPADIVFYYRQNCRCIFANIFSKQSGKASGGMTEFMTLQYKIYAALIAAAVLLLAIAGTAGWSKYKIGKLEQAVGSARVEADKIEQSAIKLEQKAAVYIQKINYLETNLAEIQKIARKQDEELEKLFKDTNDSRAGVLRARSVRTIQSTGAELCAKLADLGHGCE